MHQRFLLLLLFSIASLPFTFSQTDNSVLLLRVENIELAYPRFSADGKKVLYQANYNGTWSLFIYEIDSGISRTLLQNNFNNNFPDWNADQSRVAFVSDRDGNEEIYVMNADGTELQRVTTDPSRDIHPYFSPDGKYLLFNSTRINGSFDIMRYDFQTKTTLPLSTTPDNETCARYAPDMKSMVYLQNSELHDDIFVADSLNKNPINLTKSPSIRDGWPVFSYDNQWVYYSAMDNGTFCIYRVRPDGADKTKLTSSPSGNEDARVSLSRQGDNMIFNRRFNKTIEIRGLKFS